MERAITRMAVSEWIRVPRINGERDDDECNKALRIAFNVGVLLQITRAGDDPDTDIIQRTA
jgi:hypothetical protein